MEFVARPLRNPPEHELEVAPALAIYILTVPDLHHDNSADVIVDGVDDSVITLPDAILLLPGQFLAPGRPGLGGERPHARDDLSAKFEGKSLQLFDGGRLDQQPIACHAASCL
ncbi:MAG: hypothetical protein ACR2HK_03675 [Gemmatimonadales bacterium]